MIDSIRQETQWNLSMFSFFKKKPEAPKYSPPEGSRNKSLAEIDTSYWRTEDALWMAERKESWTRIEIMLRDHKSNSKAMNIIKAYYLKGKMPNWAALEKWPDDYGHVDLLVFLWLHPSWDETLLRELRDLFVYSDLILPRDIGNGIGFFTWSLPIMTTATRAKDRVDYPVLDGHTELLFRVMMGEPVQMSFEVTNPKSPAYVREYHVRVPELDRISMMGRWLVHNEMLPVHREFLYQYDQPLEWWYQCVKDVDYFNVRKANRKNIPSINEALYRIYHFDTAKEGETGRTRFVQKIRRMLDERDFIPEFKQMWQDVKHGKTVVQDAWKMW
jgi:hypothetical protein